MKMVGNGRKNPKPLLLLIFFFFFARNGNGNDQEHVNYGQESVIQDEKIHVITSNLKLEITITDMRKT